MIAVVVGVGGATLLMASHTWAPDRCALSAQERALAVARWEKEQLQAAGLARTGGDSPGKTPVAYDPLPADTAFKLALEGAAAQEALRRPPGGIYVPPKAGCAFGTRL